MFVPEPPDLAHARKALITQEWQDALKARPKLEAKVQELLAKKTQQAAANKFARQIEESQEVLKDILEDND